MNATNDHLRVYTTSLVIIGMVIALLVVAWFMPSKAQHTSITFIALMVIVSLAVLGYCAATR